LTTVEIYGELRLLQSDSKLNDYSLHTPRDLFICLRDIQLRLNYEGKENQPSESTEQFLLQTELDLMRKSFKPFIKVYSIRKVLNAKNLIDLNLRLRKKLPGK
jgi:hypothetical protein